jgi:EAL domain-containing protein (putative c-di-GMP-specific phosphodiesterase class I)
MRAIAEGVEDPAVMARLKTLGCDAVQGYAVSPPREADEMTEWLLVRRGLTELGTGRRSAA